MNNFKHYVFAIIFLLFTPGSALSGELFSIEPGKIPFWAEGKVSAAWKLKGGGEPTEGINIYFFGEAERCKFDSIDGPVEKYEKGGAVCYKPISDKKLCDSIEKIDDSCSFICFNGGIKLHTGTGLSRNGLPCFVNARNQEGIGGKINAYNLGSFVNFKLPGNKIIYDGEHTRIKITFRCDVEKISLNPIPREHPLQAHQKVVIGFRNRDCIKEKKDGKSLCNVEYLLVHFVKRISKKTIKWEKTRIWFDQGQGGMPIISVFSDSEFVTFCGDSLKHEPFKTSFFCYEISWAQFLYGLKVVASKYFSKPIGFVTTLDLISLFGSQYHNPSAWYLSVVSFSHEIHDPYKDFNNHIEGTLKELHIITR